MLDAAESFAIWKSIRLTDSKFGGAALAWNMKHVSVGIRRSTDEFGAARIEQSPQLILVGLRLKDHDGIGSRRDGRRAKRAIGRRGLVQVVDGTGRHDNDSKLRRHQAGDRRPAHGVPPVGIGRDRMRGSRPKPLAKAGPARLHLGRIIAILGSERALGTKVRLACGAFRKVLLNALAIGSIQLAGDVPRKQLFGFIMRIDRWIVHLNLYTQSPASPGITAFNLRRAWNMRVFTVSIGQPMISAISR